MAKKHLTLTLASLLGIGMLAVAGGSASAMMIPAAQQIVPNGNVDSAGLLIAAHVTSNGQARPEDRRWDSRRDGQRCRYRNGNCKHYYQGYYYFNPWWQFARPPVFGGVFFGNTYAYQHNSGNRHVQWCYDHYRSYNARYNTWVGYSGRVYQCRSPY
jgi:hypothetical protein